MDHYPNFKGSTIMKQSVGNFKYFPICKQHFEEDKEVRALVFKKFAGQPAMINLVKPEQCEVCKNGEIS